MHPYTKATQQPLQILMIVVLPTVQQYNNTHMGTNDVTKGRKHTSKTQQARKTMDRMFYEFNIL